jgi:hypothetical protein
MRRPLASWRKLPLPTPSRHNLSPSPPFSRRTQPLLAVHRRMEQLRLHLPAPLSVVTSSTFPWTPPSPSSKAHRAAAPSFPVDPWCWEVFSPLLEFVAAFPCTGSSHGRPPFFLPVPGSSTPTQGQRLPWPAPQAPAPPCELPPPAARYPELLLFSHGWRPENFSSAFTVHHPPSRPSSMFPYSMAPLQYSPSSPSAPPIRAPKQRLSLPLSVPSDKQRHSLPRTAPLFPLSAAQLLATELPPQPLNIDVS